MKFVGSSMQLRGHLNQVIVDQLPPLVHLEQWLVQLSVGGSAMVWQNQSRKKILVLEMVAEIHQRLTELARARRDSVKTPFSFFFPVHPNVFQLLSLLNSSTDKTNQSLPTRRV